MHCLPFFFLLPSRRLSSLFIPQFPLTRLCAVCQVAIKCAYTTKNFKTCAGLCQRVLELCLTNQKSNLSKAVDVAQIKGVLKACEKTPTDAADLKYSDSEAFVLCADSFTPLSKNTPIGMPLWAMLLVLCMHLLIHSVVVLRVAKCPYCQASYKQSCAGSLCRVCQLSKIDAEASGLRVYPADK